MRLYLGKIAYFKPRLAPEQVLFLKAIKVNLCKMLYAGSRRILRESKEGYGEVIINMPKKEDIQGYNDRLFSKGFRGFFHFARYNWVKSILKKMDYTPENVVELGCFDGKLINFLPTKPKYYVGYDANWDSGLDKAKQLWGSETNFRFRLCQTAMDMDKTEKFDTAFCMETLEHLENSILMGYLQCLASVTTEYIFITVPNEQGILFLFKYFIKKFLPGNKKKYTIKEIILLTFGLTKKVKRNQHKGFNYKDLCFEIGQLFEIKKVVGIPFAFLPKSFNTTIGIVASPKKTSNC